LPARGGNVGRSDHPCVTVGSSSPIPLTGPIICTSSIRKYIATRNQSLDRPSGDSAAVDAAIADGRALTSAFSEHLPGSGAADGQLRPVGRQPGSDPPGCSRQPVEWTRNLARASLESSCVMWGYRPLCATRSAGPVALSSDVLFGQVSESPLI